MLLRNGGVGGWGKGARVWVVDGGPNICASSGYAREDFAGRSTGPEDVPRLVAADRRSDTCSLTFHRLNRSRSELEPVTGAPYSHVRTDFRRSRVGMRRGRSLMNRELFLLDHAHCFLWIRWEGCPENYGSNLERRVPGAAS